MCPQTLRLKDNRVKCLCEEIGTRVRSNEIGQVLEFVAPKVQ